MNENNDRILRWKELKAEIGLSRTTVWRLEQQSEFPKKIQLSPGCVGWRKSEIETWKLERLPVQNGDAE